MLKLTLVTAIVALAAVAALMVPFHEQKPRPNSWHPDEALVSCVVAEPDMVSLAVLRHARDYCRHVVQKDDLQFQAYCYLLRKELAPVDRDTSPHVPLDPNRVLLVETAFETSPAAVAFALKQVHSRRGRAHIEAGRLIVSQAAATQQWDIVLAALLDEELIVEEEVAELVALAILHQPDPKCEPVRIAFAALCNRLPEIVREQEKRYSPRSEGYVFHPRVPFLLLGCVLEDLLETRVPPDESSGVARREGIPHHVAELRYYAGKWSRVRETQKWADIERKAKEQMEGIAQDVARFQRAADAAQRPKFLDEVSKLGRSE